jgi:hypothetical protein
MADLIVWNSIPVPYVAMWSSERYSHVAPCRTVGGKLATFCAGGRGEGSPVFGKMEDSRQRTCMNRRKCQVCFGPLYSNESYALDFYGTATVGRRNVPVIQEPPVCLVCAKTTLSICPGTKRRRARGELHCYRIRKYIEIGVLVGPADDNGGELTEMLRPYKGKEVIAMIRAALTDFDVITPEEIEDANLPG